MDNRRAAQRWFLLSGARLRIGEAESEALVHDINESGCRITVPYPLERDTSLHLTIGIPGVSEPVDVLAIVAWVEPIKLSHSFQAGLRFVEFSRPQHFQHLSLTLDRERMRRESFESPPTVFTADGSSTELSLNEVKRLAFLANLSRHLNRSHEVAEVAQIAVNSVAEIMRAERVMLMMDRGGLEPEILAYWGLEPDPAQDGTQPSFSLALVASPNNVCTSVGLK